MLATVDLVDKHDQYKIIVAIPVAAHSAIRRLKDNANVDEVVCLQTPYDFRAVGQYYEKFYQVSDAEAIQLLEETNTLKNTSL
jgi:predicted phosphoribosyltransferase